MIWQGVKEIYEIVPTRDWKKEENQTNRVVFIGNILIELFFLPPPRKKGKRRETLLNYLFCFAGHNLDEKILRESFRACVAS